VLTGEGCIRVEGDVTPARGDPSAVADSEHAHGLRFDASFHRAPAGMPVSGSRSTTTSPTGPAPARASQVFAASASTLSRLE
jgi:hypothetical protein